MPKLTLEESKDLDCLPEDSMIIIEVVEIAERHVPGRDGKDGWDKLEFKCVIKDVAPNLREDYSELIGTNIWGSTGMRFTTHPDNKLRQWSEALLDMGELDQGFELDTDILIGRKAKAVTGTYTKRGSTSKRHEINGMLPFGPLGGSTGPANQEMFAAASGGFDDDPPF